MGKIVTLMSDQFVLQEEHFNKDVYFVGQYLANDKGYDYEVVCTASTLSTGEYNGKKLVNLGEKIEKSESNEFFHLKYCKKRIKIIRQYLKIYSKEIDILILFHPLVNTALNAKWYKKYNPNGKIYIKLDNDCSGKSDSSTIKQVIKRFYFHPIMKKYADIISTETKKGYDHIIKEGFYGVKIDEKLIWMPNGIPEDIVNFPHRLESEKENLIITIGRIGTYHKNNEMLINSLRSIDLGDWKIKLIGPYSKNFENFFNEILLDIPDLVGKVELIGPVYDKKKLYEYYDRAKAFVLTSRCESFGLVLAEALGFNNYIISTDVGAAKDLTDNGRLGKIIECGDENMLAKAISNCIKGDVLNETLYKEIDLYKTKFYWSDVIKLISKRL